MTRISGVRLNKEQTSLLTRILQSATPHLAKAETEFGRKSIANAELLRSIGAITVDEESAEITDRGKQIMRDEGLIDNSDQLTKYALAVTDQQNGDDSLPARGDSGMGGSGGMGDFGGSGGMGDLGDELEGDELGDLEDEALGDDLGDPEDEVLGDDLESETPNPKSLKTESFSLLKEMTFVANRKS